MTRVAADRVTVVPEPTADPEPSNRIGQLFPLRPYLTAVRERLALGRLRSFAQSSPGQLIGLGLLLVALCLAAGVVSGASVNDRQHGLDLLLTDIEPDANSAHHLYTSLSVADAAASTAFISGGLEPQAVRDRYTQAMGEAAAELVRLSGDDIEDLRRRMGIASGLPVYSGLVETARANNRAGYPVGAAYLSEASNQMQTVLLPMAEQLHDRRAAAVDEAQRHQVRPPWLAFLLLLAALGTLIWAQTLLARRWRRTFNAGLLLASAAMLILLAWTVFAGAIAATSMAGARSDEAVLSARLTESRILAQQARSAETLKLVRRDTSGDYDRTFDANITRLKELLSGHDDPASTTARTALDQWLGAHRRMNDALNRGDFARAATSATGPGAVNATIHVEKLDQALGQGIAESRDTLRDKISRSARVFDYLAPGAVILGIAAAGYIVFGIWPRLREYQ